jgi:hypothetical protein
MYCRPRRGKHALRFDWRRFDSFEGEAARSGLGISCLSATFKPSRQPFGAPPGWLATLDLLSSGAPRAPVQRKSPALAGLRPITEHLRAREAATSGLRCKGLMRPENAGNMGGGLGPVRKVRPKSSPGLPPHPPPASGGQRRPSTALGRIWLSSSPSQRISILFALKGRADQMVCGNNAAVFPLCITSTP